MTMFIMVIWCLLRVDTELKKFYMAAMTTTIREKMLKCHQTLSEDAALQSSSLQHLIQLSPLPVSTHVKEQPRVQIAVVPILLYDF